MLCTNCSAELEANWLFCPMCKNAVAGNAETAVIPTKQNKLRLIIPMALYCVFVLCLCNTFYNDWFETPTLLMGAAAMASISTAFALNKGNRPVKLLFWVTLIALLAFLGVFIVVMLAASALQGLSGGI